MCNGTVEEHIWLPTPFFGLPPLPGDVVQPNPRYSREARAELTDVTDRIAAADNENDPKRYRASR